MGTLREIERLRTRIDDIDNDIVEMLKRRHECARLLGEIKRRRGLPLKDPKRERQILRRVQSLSKKMRLEPDQVREIFGRIFKMSVQAQAGLGSELDGELSGEEVLVVGGSRGMGLFFARLAQNHGASVRILGRNMSRARRVAEEYGFESGRISDAASSDLVVVSVPIGATLETCLQVASLMKEGSFLTDLSSVKSGITDLVAPRTSPKIEYVSLHPLFGPDATHIYGQHILAIPYRGGSCWRRLARLFSGEGARVHITTALAHDRAMSSVQVLHHFGLLCIGLCLGSWNWDYDTSSLRLTLESIRRLVRNWNTFYGIQEYNPFADDARSEFLRTVRRMVEMDPCRAQAALRSLSSSVQKWSRKQ